jgi:hypothetical protein
MMQAKILSATGNADWAVVDRVIGGIDDVVKIRIGFSQIPKAPPEFFEIAM